ncbi:MAG: GTPase Era [Treponema sp.]|nr:GTPase Era [Treponema sp.]
MIKKCGFVTIIGRPSVGKSTLLNKMCGEKVAIVSKVPQTTRNAIRGIVNREEGQLIFIDTPGRHSSEKKMNKKLMDVSNNAISESDLILYIIDAFRAPGQEEEEIVKFLTPLTKKVVIAINKIDVPDADINRSKEFITKYLPSLSPSVPACDFNKERIFTISAFTGQGVEELLSVLYDMMPEGQPLYDSEYYTDQETEFRIAEIIREQAINRLRQELPHSLYVEIADMEFKEDDKNGQLWVRAFIIVERESQKGMVVGKGGEMIKAIRLASLKNFKQVFDWKIDLDLRVKTGKDWRQKDHTLKKIIDR